LPLDISHGKSYGNLTIIREDNIYEAYYSPLEKHGAEHKNLTEALSMLLIKLKEEGLI